MLQKMEMPRVYRPIPRRAFEFVPASPESSRPPSPSPEAANSDTAFDKRLDLSSPPSRTRSILNLTSSTLFGIYSPTGHEINRDGAATPWGTGAQTPSKRRSLDGPERPENLVNWSGQTSKPQPNIVRKRKGFRRYYLPLALQTALLFVFGVAYGTIITQLQKTQYITPVPIPTEARDSTSYHIIWGVLGIMLGNALPIVDAIWEEEFAEESIKEFKQQDHATRSRPSSSHGDQSRASSGDDSIGPMWYSAVRSVGAFVGIAFAVRRIPWQSTLQVSLTLALANPVLWYLIDRSMPGFAFSSAVGIAGTFALLLVNPNFVPVPAIHQAVASEQFGVFTWLASILFCTSLCFGAIGRKLRL